MVHEVLKFRMLFFENTSFHPIVLLANSGCFKVYGQVLAPLDAHNLLRIGGAHLIYYQRIAKEWSLLYLF